MRALVLLLLLANLLFAAWAHWVAPARAPAGRATPSAGDSGAIRLLREARPGQQVPGSPGAALDPRDETLACVSAGPYLERARAGQVESRLVRLGFAVRLREAREDVRTGDWVRIEDLATPEDAANALVQLRAAGIADAYVLAAEDAAGGNVISLGVFSDPDRAAQAGTIARMAGYEPRTIERTREADVYWLDIDRQASAGLPTPEQLDDADAATVPPIALRRCPAAPATPDGAPNP